MLIKIDDNRSSKKKNSSLVMFIDNQKHLPTLMLVTNNQNNHIDLLWRLFVIKVI